jgi:5-methylcytosine-specific restriction protein A
MSVLFYWKRENYVSDMAAGKAYHLNQNNELIINLNPGEHIWAFTRINGTYVLAADLVVLSTQPNTPGYKYGAYRAVANTKGSRYFDVRRGLDVEPVVRRIFPLAPSVSKTGRRFGLGSFFQGMNGVRPLSFPGERLLTAFAGSLPTI